MKTITIRLPDELAADIEAEAKTRNVSKSDVVRDRLRPDPSTRKAGVQALSDLIGSVEDDLPADLSARKKHYLRTMGYGRNSSR